MTFQMPVFIDSNSTDVASVRRQQTISQIRDSSPSDQKNAIAERHREAEASAGDEKPWTDLALGLFEARHLDDVCELFRKPDEAFPDQDFYRLNVATCYSQMAQFELCRHELEKVKNSGHAEEARRYGVARRSSALARHNRPGPTFTGLQMSALRRRATQSRKIMCSKARRVGRAPERARSASDRGPRWHPPLRAHRRPRRHGGVPTCVRYGP